MSNSGSVLDHLIEQGRALGLSEADVTAMYHRSLPVEPQIQQVTRWTRCPECRTRAVRTITWNGDSEGAWSCSNDYCWSEYVDTFTFTKAEMAYFERVEDEAT